VKRAALLLLALLAGCGEGAKLPGVGSSDSGDALDQQAIEKGLLPDPDNLAFAGRFETRSELGTDKFCATGNGGRNHDVGYLAVFGPESKCEGQGTATIDGNKVNIRLTSQEQCSFDAEYDGIVLRFPGSVPKACASYCSRNANMSGTRYYFVDPGNKAAQATLGRDIERLCR
jgi:hypothetical protein